MLAGRATERFCNPIPIPLTGSGDSVVVMHTGIYGIRVEVPLDALAGSDIQQQLANISVQTLFRTTVSYLGEGVDMSMKSMSFTAPYSPVVRVDFPAFQGRGFRTGPFGSPL